MYLQRSDVVKDIQCNELIRFDCEELFNASRAESRRASPRQMESLFTAYNRKTDPAQLTDSAFNRLQQQMITSYSANSENGKKLTYSKY